MRNLLNPKWLFVINTLPLLILFFLLFGQFTVIQTLLDEDSFYLWKSFGLWLGLLGLLNFLYALFLVLKKKIVSAWYGFLTLFLYILFIYLYAYNLDRIMPDSVPQWMVSGDILLFVGTFLMPSLVHSLAVLVSHFTPQHKEQKVWPNFLISFIIPVVSYLFMQTLFPLWQKVEGQFFIHSFIVLIITFTLVFLFFLFRGVYVYLTKSGYTWEKYKMFLKILIALILPLVGLLVNNGHLFSYFGLNNAGLFGDFSHTWFYILAVLNGILLCLPNPNSKRYRIFLFFGRAVTFVYTFYFFLVFLPFLPLSVVALTIVGTGFLLLTPLLLLIIHTSVLIGDIRYLRGEIPRVALLAIGLFGLSVIPVSITQTYLKDKRVLNETLDYLYNPNYKKEYDINKDFLRQTLITIKSNKHRKNGMFDNRIPYLSTYFNWLVMDNLSLSDAKINTIEEVFFGKTSLLPNTERGEEANAQNNNKVYLSNIATSSTFDATQQAWKSWIDLELTNKSENARLEEYATTIDLPEGAWISDYYLFVGDKKEPGILAEKKSAMWVFSQIQNENRDPGILHYLTGNKVALKVFPFAKNEVRKTGIEILHKEPISLKIDTNTLVLGDSTAALSEVVETENVAYISAKQKQNLKPVKRQAYFHFLLDVSKDKKEYKDDFIRRIERVLLDNKALAENAKISFVNSYIKTFDLDDNWKEKYNKQEFGGGFYLDRAINTTLLEAYQEQAKNYPVIVVVTDALKDAILNKDFCDLELAFPESDLFFNLDKKGTLKPHSLVEQAKKELSGVIVTKDMFSKAVLEYKLPDNYLMYLPDNNKANVVLKKDFFNLPEADVKERNWESALKMQAQWYLQIFRPELSHEKWRDLVKYSFISKVMSPVTSYLVVENEAQKVMLKKKQQQALEGNKSLDLGEDVRRMSGPSLLLVVLLFASVVWYRERRKRQKLG